MTNLSLGTPLERLAALNRHHHRIIASTPSQPDFNNTATSDAEQHEEEEGEGEGGCLIRVGVVEEQQARAERMSPARNSSARIWLYQTCAEFGCVRLTNHHQPLERCCHVSLPMQSSSFLRYSIPSRMACKSTVKIKSE